MRAKKIGREVISGKLRKRLFSLKLSGQEVYETGWKETNGDSLIFQGTTKVVVADFPLTWRVNVF